LKKAANATPVRRALRGDSTLLPCVQDGLGAVESSHRAYFEATIRSAFGDSLNADEALREDHDADNRWDYLLGHEASDAIVAVEPHSAREDEVGTVIKKRLAAIEQLRTHVRDGVKIAKWLWVASGKVHFANTEKARRRLDQNGIEFVGTRVMTKHLPATTAPTADRGKPPRRRRTRRKKK
jgi:hypothetical protein